MKKFACGKSVLRICARGFTLSEVMIVLIVIGVITGILLPTAIQSTPDKNVMKFKKINSTLGMVMRELVTSSKYYKDGNLAIRSDGTVIDGTNEGDITYFCETIADNLNIKSKNCSSINTGEDRLSVVWISNNYTDDSWVFDEVEAGARIDEMCKIASTKMSAEIVLPDGVELFLGNPATVFGTTTETYRNNTMANDCTPEAMANGTMEWCKKHWFTNFVDNSGFLIIYRVYCVDIDGIAQHATESDCINECPFGYAIRPDGKLFAGARAQEWMSKGIQKEE